LSKQIGFSWDNTLEELYQEEGEEQGRIAPTEFS
jgi:hypothetical protein